MDEHGVYVSLKPAQFYGLDNINNILKFLAMVITILLQLEGFEFDVLVFECILSLGNNTSPIGWLHKSSRISSSSIYFKPVCFISRHLALKMTNLKQCLCREYLCRSYNIVLDFLTFTSEHQDKSNNPLAFDDLLNCTLTQPFHSHLPQLIPQNFNISSLSSNIASFAFQALQMMESSLITKIRHKRG